MLYQATGRDLAVNDLLAPALVGFVEGSELPEVERANQGEWQVCTSMRWTLVRTCAPDVSNRPSPSMNGTIVPPAQRSVFITKSVWRRSWQVRMSLKVYVERSAWELV